MKYIFKGIAFSGIDDSLMPSEESIRFVWEVIADRSSNHIGRFQPKVSGAYAVAFADFAL